MSSCLLRFFFLIRIWISNIAGGHNNIMGKKSKKNKEVRPSSREEARAGDGQIVRIGEKEKCTDCKNWIPWGFTMRIGTPPFRADCGPGAKCVSLFLYLHDVIL